MNTVLEVGGEPFGEIAHEAAFEQFFSDQFPVLVRYLCGHGLGAEDAQDVAQESLFKLHRYRQHPAAVLRTLMYRIAMNGLRDLRRRQAAAGTAQHVSLELEGHALQTEQPHPEQHALTHEELARVRNVVATLPERCRQIYLLNRIDGLSYSQISAHCGISVKAVEKHMTKALGSLRSKLQGEAPMQGRSLS